MLKVQYLDNLLKAERSRSCCFRVWRCTSETSFQFLNSSFLVYSLRSYLGTGRVGLEEGCHSLDVQGWLPFGSGQPVGT